MNDFSEIENELKKLRPAQPSRGLFARIEQAVVDPSTSLRTSLAGDDDAAEKIIRPSRFKLSWVSLGVGLAAAAVFLIFARLDVERTPQQKKEIAQDTPALQTRSTTTPATFIPTGATQVVYHSRDEGLHFPSWSQEPVRRVRYQKQETLQWRNPTTGASLRVSYPSEEVVLTPVSGQ
jgi:hypothetical protein